MCFQFGRGGFTGVLKKRMIFRFSCKPLFLGKRCIFLSKPGKCGHILRHATVIFAKKSSWFCSQIPNCKISLKSSSCCHAAFASFSLYYLLISWSVVVLSAPYVKGKKKWHVHILAQFLASDWYDKWQQLALDGRN